MKHNWKARIRSYSKATLLIVMLTAMMAIMPAPAAAEPPDPAAPAEPNALNPAPPTTTTKLVFIHHSCGTRWMNTDDGDLGNTLGTNNYYVSDVSYGWGDSCPDCSGCDKLHIGSCTDIGHWWEWFRGSNSSSYLTALYGTTNQFATYTRPMADPGGENEIIMFKSCYPNSHLLGSPGDTPTTGDNALRGKEWDAQVGGEYVHTVSNVKGIYNDLLAYFETRQDKLFIVITAPPLVEVTTDATEGANIRAFNQWLVNDWLASYSYHNVAVFDFYNVLTSNGGDEDTNDLDAETGNHHRYRNSIIQYITDQGSNFSRYPSGYSDSHPTNAGNQKATGEYVPLLNIAYNCWKNGECEGEVSDWISVDATPSSVEVSQREAAVYTLSVTSNSTSLSEPVSFSLEGHPQDVTFDFNPSSVTPPGDSQLTITTTLTTQTGTYPLTITATSDVLQDTANISLIVTEAAADFELTVIPAAEIADRGQEAVYSVGVTGVGGFSEPVDLIVSGLPTGVSASWGNNPVTPGQSSALTLTVSASAPYGKHALQVIGSSDDTLDVTEDFSLIVNYPFKIYLPLVLKEQD